MLMPAVEMVARGWRLWPCEAWPYLTNFSGRDTILLLLFSFAFFDERGVGKSDWYLNLGQIMPHVMDSRYMFAYSVQMHHALAVGRLLRGVLGIGVFGSLFQSTQMNLQVYLRASFMQVLRKWLIPHDDE